jgi:glucosamine kinase
MEYYLGIDAGGSHTRARLVTAEGQVVGTREAGPANPPIRLDEARKPLSRRSARQV